MRAMKGVLKEWNRDSFGNVGSNYRELVEEIEQLDARLNGGERGVSEINAIARNKMAVVSDYLDGDQDGWTGFFCRTLRAFEVSLLHELQSCVGQFWL
ncbi:hypothetical protein V6N13_106681 [Hibiscus sabdariffa]